MPEEAKDLIERLLRLKPIERLGAGEPGSPNDLQQLLRHPYFKTVDLPNLHLLKVQMGLPSELENQ